MRTALLAFALSALAPSVAFAERITAGSYLCIVEQKAGIGSTHLEGAGPPESRSNHERYRFRIHVSAIAGGRLRIVEAPYTGREASTYQWEDDNSTLHTPYVGDGAAFVAEDGPGFMNFGRDRWGEGLQFYHSAFEYAGGEDEQVNVRWGRCTRE